MAAPTAKARPAAGGSAAARAANVAGHKPVTLRIFRYNPDTDAKPEYREYTVQADPTDRVLDALNTVKWYQDGTLTYRRSCAHGRLR